MYSVLFGAIFSRKGKHGQYFQRLSDDGFNKTTKHAGYSVVRLDFPFTFHLYDKQEVTKQNRQQSKGVGLNIIAPFWILYLLDLGD